MQPSSILVQPRKTHPYITEKLLIERKESNQTNKTILSEICSTRVESMLLTVNSEIFARISFSRIALKEIFATLKFCYWGMIYLYQYSTE